MRKSITALAAGLVTAVSVLSVAFADDNGGRGGNGGANVRTTTPIKHLVVIFQENVSFDHYFGTYPFATNPTGEPRFEASARTPSVNGLSGTLLTNNPNLNPANNSLSTGLGATNPFRLDRSEAATNDQNHNYLPEQLAFDHGLMDLFPASVGTAGPPPADEPIETSKGLTMGYYDGNTVTAYWNYAQHFAMSDNSFDTTFGPSTPGALNLVSGQTHGFATTSPSVTANSTVIGDPQPAGDKCDTRDATTSTDPKNTNVGDLLNVKGTTWGWFQGGFADCTAAHSNVGGVSSLDYI